MPILRRRKDKRKGKRTGLPVCIFILVRPVFRLVYFVLGQREGGEKILRRIVAFAGSLQNQYKKVPLRKIRVGARAGACRTCLKKKLVKTELKLGIKRVQKVEV